MNMDVKLNYKHINELKLKNKQDLQRPEALDLGQAQKCRGVKHL